MLDLQALAVFLGNLGVVRHLENDFTHALTEDDLELVRSRLGVFDGVAQNRCCRTTRSVTPPMRARSSATSMGRLMYGDDSASLRR